MHVDEVRDDLTWKTAGVFHQVLSSAQARGDAQPGSPHISPRVGQPPQHTYTHTHTWV